MPRVTRAQAEAAMRSLKWRADAWAGERACRDDLAMQANERFEATIRAYLAQRPDEDTVRRGNEALERLRTDGIDFDNEFGPRENPSVQDDYDASRAAMYQPEEEA